MWDGQAGCNTLGWSGVQQAGIHERALHVLSVLPGSLAISALLAALPTIHGAHGVCRTLLKGQCGQKTKEALQSWNGTHLLPGRTSRL